MINCVVTVYKDVDVLDHGHRGDTPPQATVLYAGPAYLSAPDRQWERQAVLEGVITGNLHVHTTGGLQTATRVSIAQHASAGEYQVLGAAVTSSEWRLALGRRP